MSSILTGCPTLLTLYSMFHSNGVYSTSLDDTLSLPLLPGPLSFGVVIPVRIFSYICQTDLFKSHSYSIGPCAKKENFKKQICKYECDSLTSCHQMDLLKDYSYSKRILDII